MSSKMVRAMCAVLPMLALAACSTVNKPIGSEDSGMGEAVRYNAAVQTINPYPLYPAGGALPGDHGEKGAKAVRRYRLDQVKEIESLGTTGGTGGSSSPPR